MAAAAMSPHIAELAAGCKLGRPWGECPQHGVSRLSGTEAQMRCDRTAANGRCGERATFTHFRRDSHGEATSRYVFDFAICPSSDGWAQVDTAEDAWCYGMWVHPERLQLVTYAEGDVSIETYAEGEGFAAAIRARAERLIDRRQWKGIDPGWGECARDAWRALELEDLLH